MANDYKKLLAKGLWSLGYVLVTGLIVVWQDDIKYMGLIPLLVIAQSYLKHK